MLDDYDLLAESPDETHTVLLVEDVAPLREMIEHALSAAGCTVLIAAGGEEAVQAASAHPGPIDILVTDLVMPGMSGAELAQELVRRRPDMQVLFISGMPDPGTSDLCETDPRFHSLPKPFGLSQLVNRLREICENRPPRATWPDGPAG